MMERMICMARDAGLWRKIGGVEMAYGGVKELENFFILASYAERKACKLRAEEFLTEPEPDWDGDLWNQAIERVVLAIEEMGRTMNKQEKSLSQPEHVPVVEEMTAPRAVYFMERFKHDEKLLGPNEQAALDFVISILEAQPEQEHIYCKDKRENNGTCPHHNLQCGWPKCNAPSKRNSRYVLMITTAYEQGAVKGHQAFLRKRKIDNPYVEGDCFDAWQMGYREGTKQAKDIEAKT